MIRFRAGSGADTDAVISLFDANVAWLVEQGRSEQWGVDPWSGNQRYVEIVHEMLDSGMSTIAEIDGEVVGASIVADHPMPYVPAIDEPERYLKLLIASPAHRGEQIGHQLIERARARTVDEGIDLLRVDCWSGGDRRLVAYYESEGFHPVEEIEVRSGTSVQLFEWRFSRQTARAQPSIKQ